MTPSVTKKLYRPLALMLMVVMLVSTACNMPWSPQPTATSETGSAEPQPTVRVPKSSQSLPPAVVETNPIEKSELSPQDSVTVYFNQPMDAKSVEENWSSSPSVMGSFEWIDEATVKFTPSNPMPINSAFKVSLGASAKATNGKTLGAPVEVQFQIANGFQVTDKLPAPESTDVDPSAAVVAVFNRPVVALVAEETDQPPAFTIEPAASGSGKWLNTSTYIWYPDPALQGGTTYTVHLNQALVGADGLTWDSENLPADWSFTTTLPALMSFTPNYDTNMIWLDSSFSMTFNQIMDQESTQQAFSLSSDNGPVAGEFGWSEDGKTVTFTPSGLLDRGMTYEMHLAGSASGMGGTPIGTDFSTYFETVPDFALDSTRPYNGGEIDLYAGSGSFSIHFTSPLARQKMAEMITISPAISGFGPTYSDESMDLYLYGYFATRSTYTITISGDLRDKWGATLGEDYTFTLSTARSDPTLSVPLSSYDGILFTTPDLSSVSAQVTNLTKVNLASKELTLAEFFERIDDYELRSSTPTGAINWTKTLDVPPDDSTWVDLPLQMSGADQKPGVFFYKVNAPEVTNDYSREQVIMVVVSNTHLLVKKDNENIWVWAIDLRSNQPITGKTVTLYGNGYEAGSADTDVNGLAKIPYDSFRFDQQVLFAVLGKPGDDLFGLAGTNWTEGVAGYDFNISMDYAPETKVLYLYTDRPIYKPGQTMFYKAVVRNKDNGRYSLMDMDQVHFTIWGAYNPQTGVREAMAEQTLDLSQFGTAEGTFTLPENLEPGYYSIESTDFPYTYFSFQVAEYRKPDVDLSVTFQDEVRKAGEEITANVKAAYFFGAPVSGLSLHWTLYASDTYFSIPGGFQTGKASTGWYRSGWYYGGYSSLGDYIVEGDAVTDADGNLVVPIDLDILNEKIDPRVPQNLTLEVTVKDQTELTVSGRASMTLHPSDVYIGVKPDQWGGQAGDEIGFTVKVVDWYQSPSAGRAFTASFSKITWVESETVNPYTGWAEITPEFELVGSTNFTTDAQGLARVAFTPVEPGTYFLEVSGDNAVTQDYVWIGGAGAAAWPNLPNQHITLLSDSDSYKPGQSAQIFFPNPLGEGTQALITVERGKVMRTMVMKVDSSSGIVNIPLSDEDAPNVYISVTLVGKKENGLSDFRQGYINLNVEPLAQTFNVEVVSDPVRAQPGELVTFTLKVTDSNGQPVQGEFSLALVDKALLALADPNSKSIIDAFYSKQNLGVSTSLALTVYSARFQAAAEAMGRGGGGGGDMAAVDYSVREDFKDTAYWNATIITGADGTAQVTAKLPDNVTTWVGDVRGLDINSRVGQANFEVVATKDLIIRPTTPQFVVAGDRVEMAATVHNNTSNDLSANVVFQANGFVLDDSSQNAVQVNVPAYGRQYLSWWGTVENVDNVELLFTVTAGDLQDSARPAVGSLPVLKFSSPQTYGTTGMLSSAGEQQELVSQPRSFTPTGGELKVELSPSLAGALISGVKALDDEQSKFTEVRISMLLPNVSIYQAIVELGINQPALKTELAEKISSAVAWIQSHQNGDGGWGWYLNGESEVYVTAYALLGLSRAANAGFTVDADGIQMAQQFISNNLYSPSLTSEVWELNRLSYLFYVLTESGYTPFGLADLDTYQERMDPWAQAMYAVALSNQGAGDTNARTIINNLEATAVRSSTGLHWESKETDYWNWASTSFESAVVIQAIARLDPAASVLTDGIRYLVASRQAFGMWGSTYSSAWVLMALTDALKGTGDLQANFSFAAALNSQQIATGTASGATAWIPVSSSVPLTDLLLDEPNALLISRTEGTGRLYYRAFLQVDRPVETASPINRGVIIERKYYIEGQDCGEEACPAVNSVALSDNTPNLQVRLTITLPHDASYLVVKDSIPAGAEVINSSLKTAQKGGGETQDNPLYDARWPFAGGWGWWIFGTPTVYSDSIQWVGRSVPAGTYELTYRLAPMIAGEYRVIPTHAYEMYFPDVEGASAGEVFSITRE